MDEKIRGKVMKYIIGAGVEFAIAWLCLYLALLKPRFKYASPIMLVVGILALCAGVILLAMGS